MERASCLMSDPNFKYTKAELGDVYREIMALHKREGCEVGFAPKVGDELEYEQFGPGTHLALVSSVCRDITRIGEGFVQSHFSLDSKARSKDLIASWLAHWAATEATTRPSVWKRVRLIWWRFNDRMGLSAPLPPLQ